MDNKKNKSRRITWIMILVLLLLAGAFFLCFYPFGGHKNDTSKKDNKNVVTASDSLRILQSRLDSMTFALADCQKGKSGAKVDTVYSKKDTPKIIKNPVEKKKAKVAKQPVVKVKKAEAPLKREAVNLPDESTIGGVKEEVKKEEKTDDKFKSKPQEQKSKPKTGSKRRTKYGLSKERTTYTAYGEKD